MSLMEIFSNPETINNLTFGQKMAASLMTMVIGLGITFLVLILIWIFIVLMGKALHKNEEVAKATPEQSTDIAGGEPVVKDDVMAAVIAAAIAAYEAENGRKNGSKLVVRRIKRVVGNTAPWLTNK